MQISRRRTLFSLGALGALGALATLPAVTLAAGGSRPRDDDFLAAVARGDLEGVRSLLAAEPGLAGARDARGRSAFVLAHVHGHGDVAAAIRSAGQELGLELDVVEAVLAEEWERFEQLAAEHPGDLARAHPIGGTPLYAGALVGSHGGWRMRSAGCRSDVAPEGGSGFTPARGALESPRAEWACIGLTDICSNGGDVNAPQRGGSSVLHAAVARRDERLVRLAIRKGADVGARDASGRTPRALAAELGWQEGERLLAEPGRLPRDDRSSRLALDANREPLARPDLSAVPQAVQSEATGNSHSDLAKVREVVGKDERLVFARSTDDELPIEASAHMGRRDIIRFHLDHGAPLSLPTAVSLGDLESVSFWLERRASLVHERGAHDFPVMWYALLGGGGAEMVEHLLHYGASLEQESMGTTTLHWCVRRGDRDLAAFLLEQGADPEPVGYRWSRDGETPLRVAQAQEDSAMVGLLRERGARR